MYAKLPSMKSLIAFEAVARHRSIVKAAEEIALTSSALSKQIQTLEDHVGVKLFIRSTRHIELTEQGKHFAESVREALQLLQQSAQAMTPRAEKHVLRLMASPGFLSYVLVPRVAAFKAAHPQISFSFSTDECTEIPDFDRKPVDAAIVFLAAPPKNEKIEFAPIFKGCYLQPMAAPSLLPNGRPLENAEQLAHYPWLKSRKTPKFWDYWLCAAGAGGLEPREVCWFDDAASMLEATAAGMGIALIGGADSAPSFSDRLRPAHGFRHYDDNANQYLVCPRNTRKPGLRAFRDWLLKEFSVIENPRAENVRPLRRKA